MIAVFFDKTTFMNLPELLMPAGSLEKLKTSVLYGADALYLGGQNFGLRTAADNFTEEELIEGVEFAHARGVKVHVVLNSFLHDEDLRDLPEFLNFLNEIKVDALIVSDLGVIETVKKYSDIPIHLSTQASCLNSYAGVLWKKMGVKRLILGREVSLDEAALIKKEVGLEVELFIHGSMCMAFSGHCTISNYTQGRDSNRGGCAHSCRFEYTLRDLDSVEKRKAYFMSSKDLQGLAYLEKFIELGIDSMKVEGRMKSPLYAGTIAKVYREALDYYQEHGHIYSEKMLEWEKELSKVTHRTYSEGNLNEDAGSDSIFDEREHQENTYAIAGEILEVINTDHQKKSIVKVRNKFNPKTYLEFLPFKGMGEAINFQAHFVEDLNGHELLKTKPSTLVRIPFIEGMEKGQVIRMRE